MVALICEESEMVACILACLVLLFASVLSRGVVVRVFRDALDHCAAPQNPCEAKPRDGSSDRSVGCPELVVNGKCTVLTYSPTLIRVRGLEKSTHVCPRTQHRPCTPQRCGAGRHRQVTVGESFFDDTDNFGAGGASPSSPVEISSNQVHMLFKHQSANSKESLLPDAALFGIIVVDWFASSFLLRTFIFGNQGVCCEVVQMIISNPHRTRERIC